MHKSSILIKVNVVISDIVNKPYSTQQSTESASFLNRQKSHPLAAQASVTAVPAAGAVKPAPVKGVDLDAPGMINEQPTYDYDLADVKDEDKPWRMPGADITDYFNYGFTEESWIQYCMKQKRQRAENSQFKVRYGISLKFKLKIEKFLISGYYLFPCIESNG